MTMSRMFMSQPHQKARAQKGEEISRAAMTIADHMMRRFISNDGDKERRPIWKNNRASSVSNVSRMLNRVGEPAYHPAFIDIVAVKLRTLAKSCSPLRPIIPAGCKQFRTAHCCVVGHSALHRSFPGGSYRVAHPGRRRYTAAMTTRATMVAATDLSVFCMGGLRGGEMVGKACFAPKRHDFGSCLTTG